jgi:hypothetical protein
MSGAILPHLQYAFMAWCSVKENIDKSCVYLLIMNTSITRDVDTSWSLFMQLDGPMNITVLVKPSRCSCHQHHRHNNRAKQTDRQTGNSSTIQCRVLNFYVVVNT